MLIGYARVSTDEQNLDLQLSALKQAGCEQIYTDKVSGTKAERKGLTEALSYLRQGDTLVVWRLDRLGRSLRHLIDTVTDFQERGIGFKSLTESIDTTTSGGKLVFHIFGALAEFEREIIRERTKAGLTAARERGKTGGRPKALTEKQVQILHQLAADRTTSVQDICRTLGISRKTFYRYVNAGQD
jgi:DNA invertase Pin-like site-specific DNA recombinase